VNYLEIRKRADKTGPAPPDGTPWPLAGVELASTPPKEHALSDVFVAQGLAEGWISLGQGKLTLHFTNHDDVVYDIVEAPGRYEDADELSGVRQENRYLLRLARRR
jgi:hypothetical protein